jgi:hypothetical protein
MKPPLARAILLTALMTGAAEAGYLALGQGNGSCGTWTATRQAQQAFGYEQWVLGFLSSIGWQGDRAGIGPLNGMDANGVWAWMDNYCRSHPPDTLVAAAGAFAYAHPR